MPVPDPFQGQSRSRAGGPANLEAVTPDDSADLSHVCQWLYVGTGGTLTVTARSGQTVSFAEFHAGWHLLELTRIHATGTTASGLVIGW